MPGVCTYLCWRECIFMHIAYGHNKVLETAGHLQHNTFRLTSVKNHAPADCNTVCMCGKYGKTAAENKKARRENKKRAWVATVQLKVLQITKVIPEMNNKQDGLVNESARELKVNTPVKYKI